MSEHPIQGMMETTMKKIREMVDANTIIGNPITSPDGSVLIPVSKVSYGFGAGGSDFPSKTQKDLFGGGTGMGVTITPVAFIVLQIGETRMLQLASGDDTASNVVKLVPELFDKVSHLFQKEKKEKDISPDL